MNAGERREGDKRQMVRRKVINGVKVASAKRTLVSESHSCSNLMLAGKTGETSRVA